MKKSGTFCFLIVLIFLSIPKVYSQNSLLFTIIKYKNEKYCCFFEKENPTKKIISQITSNDSNIFHNAHMVLGPPVLPYLNTTASLVGCEAGKDNLSFLPDLLKNCYLNPSIDVKYVLKKAKLKRKNIKYFHNKNIEVIILPYNIKCCEYSLSNPGFLSMHPYLYNRVKLITESKIENSELN